MYMINKQPKREVRRMEDILLGDLFKDMMPRTQLGSMKTNIVESEDKYTLEVELPGYSKEDMSISLDDGYLSISATKKSEKEDSNTYVLKERYEGTISRTYYVGDIDKETIEASYVDGMLKVELPKNKKEETKKIINIK